MINIEVKMIDNSRIVINDFRNWPWEALYDGCYFSNIMAVLLQCDLPSFSSNIVHTNHLCILQTNQNFKNEQLILSVYKRTVHITFITDCLSHSLEVITNMIRYNT